MEPGVLVGGRYRIRALVGHGAMGVVWAAHDGKLDRQVAVKQLRLDRTKPREAEEAKQRAMREGRIAGRLRHPNAVAIFDVVEHDGSPCLVMEFLRGESLADRGVKSPREAADIGRQLASALAAAHDAGIVHRDIKPDNILITDDGLAKITDFGISRAAGDASVTATGILAGTPAYLAPEVAKGGDADFRSDVFSLGATLYAVLEGMPPFGVDDNAIAMLHRVAAGTIRPPRRSGVLTGPLLWLLHRNPAERPTMRAAEEVLAAAARGRPMRLPVGPHPTLHLPRRRLSRRAVVTGIVAAVLVAAGVVAGILLSGADEDEGRGGGDGAPGTDTTTVAAAPPCSARFETGKTWKDGYAAKVTVSNDGDAPLTGWKLTWTMPEGHRITDLWQARYSQDGTTVNAGNETYNVVIDVGRSVEFGMNVTAQDAPAGSPDITCQEN